MSPKSIFRSDLEMALKMLARARFTMGVCLVDCSSLDFVSFVLCWSLAIAVAGYASSNLGGSLDFGIGKLGDSGRKMGALVGSFGRFWVGFRRGIGVVWLLFYAEFWWLVGAAMVVGFLTLV